MRMRIKEKDRDEKQGQDDSWKNLLIAGNLIE
jgi:hypothetical protein